jgi:microcin C transport system ATP-binding protein
MQAGQIIETGNAEQLFTTPQHPYTQNLLRAAFFRQAHAENG